MGTGTVDGKTVRPQRPQQLYARRQMEEAVHDGRRAQTSRMIRDRCRNSSDNKTNNEDMEQARNVALMARNSKIRQSVILSESSNLGSNPASRQKDPRLADIRKLQADKFYAAKSAEIEKTAKASGKPVENNGDVEFQTLLFEHYAACQLNKSGKIDEAIRSGQMPVNDKARSGQDVNVPGKEIFSVLSALEEVDEVTSQFNGLKEDQKNELRRYCAEVESVSDVLMKLIYP
nr:hypothetical protein [Endozoicomonas sp.]